MRDGDRMGRKLETAHISFDLVTIPVGIYQATPSSTHSSQGTRITQIEQWMPEAMHHYHPQPERWSMISLASRLLLEARGMDMVGLRPV